MLPKRRSVRLPQRWVVRAGVVVLLVGLWLLSVNRWARVREGYVRAHRGVASVLNGDTSEGQIFTKRLPRAGFPLPRGPGGCVWDVGANDGVWNSNSHYLLHNRGFQGWLFEPDAATFLILRNMYGRVDTRGGRLHERVRLFNLALAEQTAVQTLRTFPIGFENTMVKTKRNQFDHQEYEYSIAAFDAKLACEQHREAISNGLCNVEQSAASDPETFTVLSIDAEGYDWHVFKAAHAPGCIWDVVILETPGSVQAVEALGYRFVFKEAYNHIFVRRPQ